MATKNKKKGKRVWCITMQLPDGKNYFCGIGEMKLPGTTNSIQGNVWNPDPNECELNGNGIFKTTKEVHFFWKTYIKKENPTSKIEVFHNNKPKTKQ